MVITGGDFSIYIIYVPTCPAGELPCSYLLTVIPDGLAQYPSGPSLPPFDCPPLQEVISQGHVLDGAVAKTKAQSNTMWRIREGVAEACGRRGASRRGRGEGGKARGGGGQLGRRCAESYRGCASTASTVC